MAQFEIDTCESGKWYANSEKWQERGQAFKDSDVAKYFFNNYMHTNYTFKTKLGVHLVLR